MIFDLYDDYGWLALVVFYPVRIHVQKDSLRYRDDKKKPFCEKRAIEICGPNSVVSDCTISFYPIVNS